MDIRLLGNVEIHGDTDVVRPRRSGERCVLAVLALHARTPVTITTLVDHVWSGAEQSDKSIDTVGGYLRKVRAAIKQAGGEAGWLRYDRVTRSCLLDIDPDRVDYHRFTTLTTRARQDDDPVAFKEALGLWRGPALADVTGHWADHRRHALEAERLAAYDDLLTAYLADGRHAEVVQITAGLVDEVTPTDRLLLLGARALAASGRLTAIPAWVRHVTGRMRQTADVAPAPDVLDEIDQITAYPVRRHRDLDSDAVPTAMFGMRADIPTFTGREEELRTLLDTVLTTLNGLPDEDGAAGGVRAVVIHTVDGMPGVGKTAFSVHAAHHLAERFPDGNLFLDLHGHTPGQPSLTPGAALESLLRAAGVDPKAIPPTLPDRARLWRDRMTGKKVLLVLDDAADHDQVRPLLPGTAGNLVLITSRHRLAALDGVTPLTLNVLPPNQALALLARLAGRTPEPDSDERAGLARIVDCCGCLPLAIALAGAQLRSHPTWSAGYLADLLAVEHDRLEHLDVGDRSVRAAFDMSFHHRPAEQQRLFRLLGVHPGPQIDTFAAAALTDGSVRAARHVLAGLHTDHLVEETAPGRYRLHDLLRVYARTLAADLAPDDRRAARDRMLAYYQHTVHTANTHLPAYHTSPLPPITTTPAQSPRFDDLAAAQAWLATELPTIAACVHQAAAGADKQPAIHLATALHRFLRLSGHTEQALDLHQTALTAARDSNDQAGQATALTNLGDVQYLRDEYVLATDSQTRALNLYTALGDRLGEATALTNLGRLQHQGGEYAAAMVSLTRALNLYTTLGDRLGQAIALESLGRVRYLLGEYAAATDNHTRALALFTAIDDRWGQANAFESLGRVRYLLGEYVAATDNHTQALALFTAVGSRLGQANALTYLGRLRYLLGEYAAATDNHTEALALFTAVGSRLGQANAHTNLGRLQHQRGEYAAATDSLTRALDLFTAVGDPDGEAETLNNMGDLALDHPEAGDPYTYFSRALTIAHDIGTAFHQARALAGQARCLLPAGDTTQAVALLRQAHSLYHTLGVPEAIEVKAVLSTLDEGTDRSPDRPSATS